MSPLRLNLISVALVLLLLGGFVFALALPGMNRLSARQTAVDDKLQEIASQQRQVGDVGPAYEALVAVEHDVMAVKARIPCHRQFGAFLNDLSTTLQRAGVADYQIHPLPERRVDGENLPEDVTLAKGAGILAVRLTFPGDFKSIFGVVARINELQRLSHIEKCLIEPAPDGVALRATIEVHAYQFCNPSMRLCEHTEATGGSAQGGAS